MSVIIKNMNMPKNCFDCPLCYDRIKCPICDMEFWEVKRKDKEFEIKKVRHPDCPLGPGPLFLVPAPGVVKDINVLNINHQFTPDELGLINENLFNLIPADASGKWVEEYIDEYRFYIYCSACGKKQKHYERTNYCPNCGAKMYLEGKA